MSRVMFAIRLSVFIALGLVISFEVRAQTSFTKLTDDPIAAASAGEYTAAWADFDGDQDLDLFTGGSQKLYQNNGDGTFTFLQDNPVVTQNASVPTAAVWGDYDNDGSLDLFVAGLGIDHFFWHRLYHGTGGGGFETVVPGISHLTKSLHAAWVDYDNDGLIDLFLPDAAPGGVNRLYRNNGPGGFSVVGAASITSTAGAWTACAWADFDNDGFSDVFLVNGSTEPDALFRNDGNGGFVPFSAATFSGESAPGTAAVWADYDNDGDLDLLVTNYPGQNALYRNDGSSFSRILDGELVTLAVGSRGAAWGDFDNDGWLDLFVGNHMASTQQFALVLFFRNNRNGTFTRLTTGAIVADRPSSSGPVWVDYDGNGLLDLFLTNSGYIEWPGPYSNVLYRNDGPAGNWIKIRLVGSRSNRSAIGAKVRVVSQTDGAALSQLRFASGDGGYQGQNLELHFGLGDADQAASIVVEWPSGAETTLSGVPANQMLVIEEDVAAIKFDPPGVQFTGSIQVSIAANIPGSTIYYTTDGSDPDENAAAYGGPITLTDTTTVRARLYVNELPASEIVSETYTLYVLPGIEFEPPGGLFTNEVSVALVNHVGAGAICYTTDGSSPTSSAPTYTGPIRLTAATTIRAQVFLNSFPISNPFEESYARVYAFEDDGVSLAWREQYFGVGYLTNPCAAADADCDGDHYTVAEEYAQGTDPTDGMSAPEIVLAVRSVPHLTFTTIAGRSYRIQRSTTLNPAVWEVVETVTATGPELRYVDEAAPDQAYYQIELIEQ